MYDRITSSFDRVGVLLAHYFAKVLDSMVKIKIPNGERTSLAIQVRHMKEWKSHANSLRPSSHIGSLLPAILILSALFIDVGAGRWGAYILTPIPGLYLPDALLVLGILTSIPNIRKLKDLPIIIRFAVALPLVYICARLLELLTNGGSQNLYLVVRDLAPFVFLSLVPLIAVALISVPFLWILWVLRISSVIHVVGVILVSLGLLSPVSVSFIQPGATALFDFRGDLQGVIVGIGLVSWGKWPGWVGANRYVQFALITFSFQLGSRAALVTALFSLLLVVFRERKWFPVWRWILLTTGALLALLALNAVVPLPLGMQREDQVSEQPTNTTIQEVVEESEQPTNTTIQEVVEESETNFLMQVFPTSKQFFLNDSESGRGTASARLATYMLIFDYLPQNTFWLLGAGPGTNILYEICTGILDAPPRENVGKVEGYSLLPKCPIDSAEAPSTLRDPHNWLLNLLVHGGAVGALIFLIAVGAPIYWSRKSPNSSLGVLVIAAYFVCGTFGVILSTPFAMLPIAVMLGWMVRSNLLLIEKPLHKSALGEIRPT